MKNGKTQLVAIVLSAVIAFSFGFGGGIAADYLTDNGILRLPGAANANTQTQTQTQTVTPDSGAPAVVAQSDNSDSKNINISLNEDSTIAEAIAAKVSPSVVGVTTTYTVTQSGGYGFFFGFGGGEGYSYDAAGTGTGIIVDEAGYILTNSHVVNDGDYKTITISLFDGSTKEGTLLWNEPILDLAIVKIEAEGLVAAELGDSDELQVGSYAAVIGNPLGLAFERSMTQGIISGLNRSITASNGSSGSATTMEGLIQTDATINSGNSGGPLLNSKGQVVGIASARASSGENMGFAIPINVAKPIVDQIKATGSFTRPYIGITGIGLGEQKSYSESQLEEYFGTKTGVYINSVSESGGAAAAGIKKGDIILSVDGIAVNTMNKINSLMITYSAGDTVSLEILREGQVKTYKVTLTDGTVFESAAAPGEEQPQGQQPPQDENGSYEYGEQRPEDGSEQAPQNGEQQGGRRGGGSFGNNGFDSFPNGN